MKTFASYIRVAAFMIIAYFLLELTLDTGDKYVFEAYPIIWAVLSFLLLFSVAIELCVTALKSILFRGLSEEAQARFVAAEEQEKEKRYSKIRTIYLNLLGSKAIEEEEEIILDHNYDGIKELDNNLPPWWVYGFYVTIVFAVVYMAKYHMFGGIDQAQEYEIEVAEAMIAIEEYKKTAKDLVDVNTVVLLTDASDLSAGKAIFEETCVACHKADGGGGIGPNLTDAYWILGGGIKNVFNTVSEGGRAGKGMVPWKTELKPSEIAQVSSYVISLGGTTPAEPKAAEGDLWVDESKEAETETQQETTTDSTAVEEVMVVEE